MGLVKTIGACILGLVVAVTQARAGDLPVTLLVHGMALDPSEHTSAWGEWEPEAPDPGSRWTGMIGALRRAGFRYGGELRAVNGSNPPDARLLNQGADAPPGQANLFALQFSPAANADGLAFRTLELNAAIQAVKRLTGAARIALVAHSAGGLVARSYLQDALPGVRYGDDVERLITIGSPHLGSAMAKSFGDLLGAQASSLKPDAELIRRLNRDLPLPRGPNYASILVRGIGADARGRGSVDPGLLDTIFADALPQDLRIGGDQVVHVLAQNLALAPVARDWERATGRPILYPLVRVQDPTPEDRLSLHETRVHEVETTDPQVQAMVVALLTPDPDLWRPKPADHPWVLQQARLLGIGAVEQAVLALHPASEVYAIDLQTWRPTAAGDDGRLSFRFSGVAHSRGNLLKINRHRTRVFGVLWVGLDAFGRPIGSGTDHVGSEPALD